MRWLAVSAIEALSRTLHIYAFLRLQLNSRLQHFDHQLVAFLNDLVALDAAPADQLNAKFIPLAYAYRAFESPANILESRLERAKLINVDFLPMTRIANIDVDK